ncbi:MAG: pyridoxine 5'-phosphate synthase [Deltaproteobacteria bacterium]|nr:pyridoxine 5'-phosphate synthase [Deltaproteobacteria bacterium]
MALLSVNVDHVATIRQARGGREPDPVVAAAMAELAGAEGIIVHLREDRRHIQDRDVRLLRETIQTKLNLEMAATEEMLKIAREIIPEMSTLVPEKREELTTEGGLDVAAHEQEIAQAVATLQEAGILVSLFIDADSNQVEAAKAVGADFVEIHTGHYADAAKEDEANRLFAGIVEAVKLAAALGLRVNAGHGLNYTNIKRFIALESEVEEYSIGHSIISRAVLVGIDQAVREMVDLVRFL